MLNSFVSFDIETTGLSPLKDKLIEIGAVKVENMQVVATFSAFVNPYMELPERIIELTGITDDMLVDADSEEVVVNQFLDFLGDFYVIGHNITFDFSFIKTILAKQKRNFTRKGVDTLKIARTFHEDLDSRTLTSLCHYYDINNTSSHRAIYDAMATFELYKKLAERFFSEDHKCFQPTELNYTIKKIEPITKPQKNYLIDLLKYHKIEIAQPVDKITKSEASRLIDKIILQYGKMQR